MPGETTQHVHQSPTTPFRKMSHSGDDIPMAGPSDRQEEEVIDYGTVDEEAAGILRKNIKFYLNLVGQPRRFSLGIRAIYFVSQIVKVICVTAVLIEFALARNEIHSLVSRDHTVMRHLLLKHWDASWETPLYPPAHGEFASYDINDLSDRINQSVYNYYHIEDLTLGLLTRAAGHDMNATLELNHFNDSGYTTETVTFPTQSGGFNFFGLNRNGSKTRMNTLTLDFKLQSRTILGSTSARICLYSECKIVFENNANIGQIIVNLKAKTRLYECLVENSKYTVHRLPGRSVGNNFINYETNVSTISLIAFCCGMVSLLAYSFIGLGGLYLCWETKRFMKKNYRAFYHGKPEETDLPWREYMNLFHYWSVVNIVADILMFTATIGRINNVEEIGTGDLDRLAVHFGVCILLQWCSILPLFNFYHQFAMLMKTIIWAFFKLMGYILFSGIIFVGFILCGYLVLGPYHPKFNKISSVSETLFALVQGDEMFTTLHLLDTDLIAASSAGDLLWWFTRVYLFSCISIFTFVVLNLMLAVVLAAYEASLKYYKEEENMTNDGPLERAMYKYVVTATQSPFRNAIIQFMATDATDSEDDRLLREHFRKFCKVTEDGRDIEKIIPRTIKAFLDAEPEDTTATREYCGIQFDLERPFHFF